MLLGNMIMQQGEVGLYPKLFLFGFTFTRLKLSVVYSLVVKRV